MWPSWKHHNVNMENLGFGGLTAKGSALPLVPVYVVLCCLHFIAVRFKLLHEQLVLVPKACCAIAMLNPATHSGVQIQSIFHFSGALRVRLKEVWNIL